jgi:aspartate racemase
MFPASSFFVDTRVSCFMTEDSLEHHSVGLIGGLAVGATIYYYQTIVDACQARGFSPRLLIAHADVERVLKLIGANELEELANYFLEFVETLETAGVKAVAIGAVAPHLCFPNLLAKTRMPMVSLVTETRHEIEARGFERVTLFGNRASMETKLFNGLEGIDVVLPNAEEITFIHETYTAIARARQGTPEQVSSLRELAKTLIARDHLDAVVLAGTDLSVVFNQTNTDFPAVDCARIHVGAIVRALEPN